MSVASTVSANTVGLTGAEQVFVGYHASFCTTAFLAACAVVLILVFVRDKKKTACADGAAKAGASAPSAAQGSDAGQRIAGGASDEASLAFEADNDPAPSEAFARAADKALSGFTLEQVMNRNAATVLDSGALPARSPSPLTVT